MLYHIVAFFDVFKEKRVVSQCCVSTSAFNCYSDNVIMVSAQTNFEEKVLKFVSYFSVFPSAFLPLCVCANAGMLAVNSFS